MTLQYSAAQKRRFVLGGMVLAMGIVALTAAAMVGAVVMIAAAL